MKLFLLKLLFKKTILKAMPTKEERREWAEDFSELPQFTTAHLNGSLDCQEHILRKLKL